MIKSYKPTSAGIRFRKTLVKHVSKNRPFKALTHTLHGPAGRSHGTIASRHKQRGSRKHYRIIDFKRDKLNIPATVATIEHDPNRGSNIALLNYADGEKRYILAPEGLEVGMKVLSGNVTEFTPGNALMLESIPLGMSIHNIELNPGQGGQIARGAGNSAQILAKEGNYVNIKLPSGEVKKILAKCMATIGVLSNSDLRNINLGKAGRKRYMGWRPHVRGVAMSDPSEHPHAGSYRDNGIGMPSPKSPWGWKTLGKKTRHRKHTNKFIVSRKTKK
ncbi:MAG TPA: 50S ribosomal protein L2 [Candidatus Saccharimonadales bacterium]|nr:50S ribosomal protein L2 [Candidatus Saccharimonadales bacterium]